jgi:hypothetical protein
VKILAKIGTHSSQRIVVDGRVFRGKGKEVGGTVRWRTDLPGTRWEYGTITEIRGIWEPLYFISR